MSDQWNKTGYWEWKRRAGSSAAPPPPSPAAPPPPPSHGNRPGGPPSWVAAALIGLGVLLFIGNLGFLPIHDVWVFWPLFPIAGGIGAFTRSRDTRGHVWGIVLILFGASFLLSSLGFVHWKADGDRFTFPPILILAGFVVLLKVLGGSSRGRQRRMPFLPPNPSQAWNPRSPLDYENSVHDFVLFGALKRKLETRSFAGGDLTSVFGNIEIDLRRTLISSPANSAVLNTTAVFGSIKLRVPQEWRVHVSGVSVLGNFEDKTIPPNIGPAAAVLVITGISLFSSVEIED